MNHQLLELERLSRALHESILRLTKEDQLSDIDRDLLKQQCIVLYDHILGHTPASVEEYSEPVVPVAPVLPVPPIVPEPEYRPLISEPEPTLNEIVSSFEKKESIQAPLFAEPVFIANMEKPVETVDKKPVMTETEIQNNRIDTILESQQKNIPAEQPLSLNERILHSIEPKDNIIEKLSTTVPSLKNAINVNLKIAFVHQLFNDNTVEYVKAIDKLNSSETIHEAMRYFNELKHNYSWDSENANVRELEQLLTKRYSS